MDYGIRLVAGLGNPGPEYAATRHNIGFRVLDRLSEQTGIPLDRNKFNACYGKGRFHGIDLILITPQSFMNRSGGPIRQLSSFYGVSAEEILIVYDDIDLAFNRIKIKEKGGHGGHNGIRSIIDVFGDRNFPRLRVGIGRPDGKKDVSHHVLSRFSREEAAELPFLIETAAEAVKTIVTDGLTMGMNRFNKTTRNSNAN
ncbi:MAG: aminoacyl-tRNA hydrolase [Deltaproteobacteria bacterium]|nr:MAG: aminoacyl-tRNA hydrolase [Deltaproteobacteria bacterium]